MDRISPFAVILATLLFTRFEPWICRRRRRLDQRYCHRGHSANRGRRSRNRPTGPTHTDTHLLARPLGSGRKVAYRRY